MKLYVFIQCFLKRRSVQYFVLFFILISIMAVIASSFEEMTIYRLPLFGITYVSSFVFLIEYIARILSAPALYPNDKSVKARLKYTFSFYGFVDFSSGTSLCAYLYILGYGSGAYHYLAIYFYYIQV